jgi:hypothetical protein
MITIRALHRRAAAVCFGLVCVIPARMAAQRSACHLPSVVTETTLFDLRHMSWAIDSATMATRRKFGLPATVDSLAADMEIRLVTDTTHCRQALNAFNLRPAIGGPAASIALIQYMNKYVVFNPLTPPKWDGWVLIQLMDLGFVFIRTFAMEQK